MRSAKLQNNEKLIITLVLLLSLIFIITYAFLLSYLYESEKNIYNGFIENLKKEYAITINGYTGTADLVFKNSFATDEVLKIVYNSTLAKNSEEKDLYRQQLYDQLKETYNHLTHYNFRQIHFHETDNRSFLRFHKPEKYGDDLTGVRYSVEYVNTFKKSISGFEEGRIFNGFRNVYPLIYNEKHIGSVELSVSMGAVIQQLKHSFDKDSQFILLQSVVDEKVFQTEQSNYTPWPIDSKFVLDSNIENHGMLSLYLDKEDRERLQDALRKNLLSGQEFVIRVKNEEAYDILAFLPIRNFENNIVAYLFSIESDAEILKHKQSFRLITTAFVVLMFFSMFFMIYFIETNRKIQNMIQFDLLTKAYTRRIIHQNLVEEFQRYQRYRNPFSICMIDIDKFKTINDTFGHQVGDSVLSELAELIMTNIRNSDHFGRYGGEEFLLILTETDQDNAFKTMENLRKIIEKHNFKTVNSVTVSAGVSTAGKEVPDVDNLIKTADENLYKAKENGRNQIFPILSKA